MPPVAPWFTPLPPPPPPLGAPPSPPVKPVLLLPPAPPPPATTAGGTQQSSGSQTAGADGWNAPVKVIYFHFEITFTGKGYFYPDGREVQRIGIVPDIIVKPTIDGIRGMKDEVLNKAIEYFNETP